MVIFVSSKKKGSTKNIRENDARPIRAAFQEVFPLNFQEKEHLEWEASFQHGPHVTLHETNSEFASENRLKPPKRNFIFQPVLFTGYVGLRELLVWERVSHITFVENMTQHWGRIKPSPGLGNTAGAGSPKQNTNTHGCFQKYGYPQSIHFNRVFHYKPSILGYPYFWKHPHSKLNFNLLLSTKCPTRIFIQETSPIFDWNKNNSSVFSHLDLGSLRTGAFVCFVGIIFWLFVSKDMGLKAF